MSMIRDSKCQKEAGKEGQELKTEVKRSETAKPLGLEASG